MQQAEEKSGGLTGNVLKWIAIVSMVIDHIGFVLIETNYDEKGTAGTTASKSIRRKHLSRS